jgi:hypothetical protein
MPSRRAACAGVLRPSAGEGGRAGCGAGSTSSSSSSSSSSSPQLAATSRRAHDIRAALIVAAMRARNSPSSEYLASVSVKSRIGFSMANRSFTAFRCGGTAGAPRQRSLLYRDNPYDTTWGATAAAKGDEADRRRVRCHQDRARAGLDAPIRRAGYIPTRRGLGRIRGAASGYCGDTVTAMASIVDLP